MWHCMSFVGRLVRVVLLIVVILILELQHVLSADAIVRLQLLRSHCEFLDSLKIVNVVLWLLIIDVGYRFVAVDATPLPSIRQYLAVLALSVMHIKRKKNGFQIFQSKMKCVQSKCMLCAHVCLYMCVCVQAKKNRLSWNTMYHDKSQLGI